VSAERAAVRAERGLDPLLGVPGIAEEPAEVGEGLDRVGAVPPPQQNRGPMVHPSRQRRSPYTSRAYTHGGSAISSPETTDETSAWPL